jgi:hypothetical protein
MTGSLTHTTFAETANALLRTRTFPQLILSIDLIREFDRKTLVDESGCWLWIGATNWKGYGIANGGVFAHKKLWEALNGPVPNGHTLHHTCKPKNCVNPLHVIPVTYHVHNNLHGLRGIALDMASQTHCKNGHELSGDNLINTSGRPKRRCKICAREYQRRYRNGG